MTDDVYSEDVGDYRWEIRRTWLGIVRCTKRFLAGDATSASPAQPVASPSVELPTETLREQYQDFLQA